MDLMNVHHTSNFFTWIKDKELRFVQSSENHVQLCGFTSTKEILGKTDYDLVWKDKANFFREKDLLILNKGLNYINIMERIQVAYGKEGNKIITRPSDILITKTRLFNRKDECIGIIGSHVDITGYNLVKKQDCLDKEGNLLLGQTFGNTYLTNRETSVLKKIVQGYTAKQIGLILNISHRTVEAHTDSIKRKLQCTTKGDIIVTAVRLGITPLLYRD